MTNYWLTFAIAERMVNNRSSGNRKDALYNTIERLAQDWWVEPTSFMAFRSESSIDTIASYCKLAIAPKSDVVLIHEVEAKRARAVGSVEHLDELQIFMPYASKA